MSARIVGPEQSNDPRHRLATAGPETLKGRTKMSNKKHDLYRLFPSHDLTDEVRVALNGAVYHLSWIKELLQRDGMRTNWEHHSGLTDDRRRRLGEDVNQFHWHLRAFFWELNAAFDTLLHWMNQTYQLGIPESNPDYSPTRCDRA